MIAKHKPTKTKQIVKIVKKAKKKIEMRKKHQFDWGHVA